MIRFFWRIVVDIGFCFYVGCSRGCGEIWRFVVVEVVVGFFGLSVKEFVFRFFRLNFVVVVVWFLWFVVVKIMVMFFGFFVVKRVFRFLGIKL